jgi:hypothetical protein
MSAVLLGVWQEVESLAFVIGEVVSCARLDGFVGGDV